MTAKVEELFDEIEELLVKENCTDDEGEKLRLVTSAIDKANRLVELEPGNADAHHLLAVCWYHHPSAAAERSHWIKHHLALALRLEPNHHFANQYLGYINFDEAHFAEALACFERTDFNYFRSLGQNWRSLKARELIVVCKLRLNSSDFDPRELAAFVSEYEEQFKRDSTNTALPVELGGCAEWLFERGERVDSPVIKTILRFFNEIGSLETVRNRDLVEAWRNMERSKP